jgi:hypothetical protein
MCLKKYHTSLSLGKDIQETNSLHLCDLNYVWMRFYDNGLGWNWRDELEKCGCNKGQEAIGDLGPRAQP